MTSTAHAERVRVLTADRFYVADDRNGLFLGCPSCGWQQTLESEDLGDLQRLAETHLAERHKSEARCEACGEPVTTWEYERLTSTDARTMEMGRGLMVHPCGHQVSRVVVEVP